MIDAVKCLAENSEVSGGILAVSTSDLTCEPKEPLAGLVRVGVSFVVWAVILGVHPSS